MARGDDMNDKLEELQSMVSQLAERTERAERDAASFRSEAEQIRQSSASDFDPDILQSSRTLSFAKKTAESAIAAAESDAQAIRDSASLEADRLLADARSKGATLLDDARAQGESQLSESRSNAETLLSEARSQAEKLTSQAQVEADRTRTTAQEEAKEILTRAETGAAATLANAASESAKIQVAANAEGSQIVADARQAAKNALAEERRATAKEAESLAAELDELRSRVADMERELTGAHENLGEVLTAVRVVAASPTVADAAFAPQTPVSEPVEDLGDGDLGYGAGDADLTSSDRSEEPDTLGWVQAAPARDVVEPEAGDDSTDTLLESASTQSAGAEPTTEPATGPTAAWAMDPSPAPSPNDEELSGWIAGESVRSDDAADETLLAVDGAEVEEPADHGAEVEELDDVDPATSQGYLATTVSDEPVDAEIVGDDLESHSAGAAEDLSDAVAVDLDDAATDPSLLGRIAPPRGFQAFDLTSAEHEISETWVGDESTAISPDFGQVQESTVHEEWGFDAPELNSNLSGGHNGGISESFDSAETNDSPWLDVFDDQGESALTSEDGPHFPTVPSVDDEAVPVILGSDEAVEANQWDMPAPQDVADVEGLADDLAWDGPEARRTTRLFGAVDGESGDKPGASSWSRLRGRRD